VGHCSACECDDLSDSSCGLCGEQCCSDLDPGVAFFPEVESSLEHVVHVVYGPAWDVLQRIISGH
jgi:hypothetical protein